MKIDPNDIAVKAIQEVWCNGRTDLIPEFYSENYKAHQPRPALNWTGAKPSMEWVGHRGLKEVVEAVRGAFPDYKETPQLVVASGDYVAMRMLNTGTHTGHKIGGLEASGRRIEVADTMFVRLENNKIAEQWGLFDEFSVALQLGFVDPSELPMLPEV